MDLFAGTTAADKPKTKTIEVEYDFAGEAVKLVITTNLLYFFFLNCWSSYYNIIVLYIELI